MAGGESVSHVDDYAAESHSILLKFVDINDDLFAAGSQSVIGPASAATMNTEVGSLPRGGGRFNVGALRLTRVRGVPLAGRGVH